MSDLNDGPTRWAKWGHSWEEACDGDGFIGGLRKADNGKILLFVPCESILDRACDVVGTGAETADWLYGKSNDGRYFALKNCRETSSPSGSQEIIADIWLTSDGEFSPEAPVTELSFNLQYLEHWATLKNEDGENVFRSYFSHFDTGTPFAHCIQKKWFSSEQLEILITSGIDTASNVPESIELKQHCSITIQFVDMVDYETASDVAYSIQLLVSFCAGWYAGMEDLSIKTSDGRSIRVAVGQSRETESWEKPFAFPVPYAVFEDRSQELIKTWLSCDGDLKSAIHEYVPIALLRRPIYVDLEYIAAWQIVETLGRVIDERDNSAEIEQSEEQVLLAREADRIESEELKEWVLAKLNEPSYPSLLNLAKGVCRYVGEFSKVVFRDKSKFAYRASTKRHSLVHRKQDVEGIQNDGDLHIYVKRLFMLSQAAIMILVGFSRDEVNELLTKYLSVQNQYLKSKLLDD